MLLVEVMIDFKSYGMGLNRGAERNSRLWDGKVQGTAQSMAAR